MKTFRLTILLIVLSTSFGLAQSSFEDETIFENELASISTQRVECISQRNGTAKVYLLIKATNRSESSISVSFKKNLWFDGKCISCTSQSDEYKVNLELQPNESISGSCDESNGLRIFVEMMDLKDVRKLSHYELENIEVNKL